uniref:ATP synthase subunit a n=1 Tax=Sinentomon erythranum TaxID=289455 RepID=G3D5N2_9HEXA|nr:ATP synthase F0 subunit 6 [Sinentomon erythranum]ADN32959.1 ATP synthase F0 subunit 6 [Sinentomon erythranum]
MGLFSVFDPSISYFGFIFFSFFFILFFYYSFYWLNFGFMDMFLFFLFFIYNDLSSLLSRGRAYFFLLFFFFLFFNNFFGLFPYFFTSSSSLCFTFSLSFSLWFSYIVYLWFVKLNEALSHLIPLGTPFFLMSFMVFIESLSLLIRPITLSVRLMANMVAGHLLLTLLGGSLLTSGGLFFGFFFYWIFIVFLELGVSIIQAYVFSMLVSLYFMESN